VHRRVVTVAYENLSHSLAPNLAYSSFWYLFFQWNLETQFSCTSPELRVHFEINNIRRGRVTCCMDDIQLSRSFGE
jgi:hypothetical protein